MADLIDRKALDMAFTMNRFNPDGTLRHWDDRDNWCMTGKEVDELIKSQPTVKTEPQWHPVSDELPDTCRMVLVCNDDGKIAVAQYVGEDGFWPWQIAYCPYDVDVWEDSENGPVMAWMELPKPWKEA